MVCCVRRGSRGQRTVARVKERFRSAWLMSVDLAKLLIISGTAHYMQHGQLVGHGPTVREISQLAVMFERIHHIACFHEGSATAMMLPYSSDRVRLIPVPFAGGDSLSEKARVLPLARMYISTIMRELRDLDAEGDVVHVRCPAPISLIAIMLMSILRSPRKRWVKYAGNWRPRRFDSIGYAIQRWWLKWNFARAKVTVNGDWPHQPCHITAFINPCLTRNELGEGRASSATKPPLSPLRLIFIGEVNKKKGVGRALEVVKRLVDQGLVVHFDIIGDGPQRADFEAQAALSLRSCVAFHGWQPRTALGPFLTQAHLMLFPSDSEGWPKVLSEAMAYGVVPVASDVSSIPQYLRESDVGITLNPYDLDSFAAAIIDYARHPARWQIESARARIAAERFTYDTYLENVSNLLQLEQSAAPP
jgi:glycosyltransferase involved in cell wall biosynthesis